MQENLETVERDQALGPNVGGGPASPAQLCGGPLLQPVQGECQCTPLPTSPLPPRSWRALQGSQGLQKQQWPSGCALISFLSYIPSWAYLQLCKFSKFSQPFPRPRHFLQPPSVVTPHPRPLPRSPHPSASPNIKGMESHGA